MSDDSSHNDTMNNINNNNPSTHKLLTNQILPFTSRLYSDNNNEKKINDIHNFNNNTNKITNFRKDLAKNIKSCQVIFLHNINSRNEKNLRNQKQFILTYSPKKNASKKNFPKSNTYYNFYKTNRNINNQQN